MGLPLKVNKNLRGQTFFLYPWISIVEFFVLTPGIKKNFEFSMRKYCYMILDETHPWLKIVLLLIDSNEGKTLGETVDETLGRETHL